MPYAPSPIAIVTPAQVVQARAGGARLTVEDDGDRIGAAIEAVSDEVNGLLGYPVIVHRVKDVAPMWRSAMYSRFTTGLLALPFVQAETEGLHLYGERAVVIEDIPDGPISYFAGYRRADMATVEVCADVAGAELTTLPLLVPPALSSFVIDAVLYRLNEADLGVGYNQTAIDIGSGTVTRNGLRTSWWDQNVHRLDPFRRIL
ncbi:MAG: hypothetical protein IAE99_07895 [Rhodothermales bacterium]|nr:hypothetical protein [Rhodothermales bacterium]